MTAVSKLENGGETLSWLWSRKVSKQGFSFENMYDTIYPEQNSTSQPAMGNRTQRRQQRSPGLPLGTSLRCPTLSNSPGKLREFLEHSKLVPPLKWHQGAHATMSSYIMLYKHPNHWHVFKSSWRQIQSKPPALTPASLCQNLSVASWYPDTCWSWQDQFTPAIWTRFREYFVVASRWQGKVHLPTQFPSPKIIPSVDQQSHTWDDSEIVTGYWGILYQLRHYYVHSSLCILDFLFECPSQHPTM